MSLTAETQDMKERDISKYTSLLINHTLAGNFINSSARPLVFFGAETDEGTKYLKLTSLDKMDRRRIYASHANDIVLPLL